MNCTGCLKPLSPVEATMWEVCLPCTRARHRAVLSHRCSCGRQRREAPESRIGSRRWVSCLRCLGQVRQIA